MPTYISTIGKFAGFSLIGVTSPRNEIVWETAKSHFNEEIIEGLRTYHRSVPNLLTLYESVNFYNNKPAKKSDAMHVKIAIAKAFDAFRFKEKVAITRIEDVKPTTFPLTTSPCLPYVRMGLRTKQEAWDTAMDDAKRMKYCVEHGIPTTFPPSMVFAKSKICHRWERKTRAIWGKSLSLLILEAMFVKSSWDEFKKGYTPAAYQVQAHHGQYQVLRSNLFDRNNNSYYVGLDFKKFDTSIPPWLIAAAFKVLEASIDFSRYTDGSRTDVEEMYKLWSRVKRTMIDTTFIMPDGWMFQKHTGVDSGSYIFQLIENICTYIMVEAGLLSQGIESTSGYVLGDDSLFWCRNQRKIDFKGLCDYIQREFGVTVSTDKSFVVNDLSEVKFLGRFIAGGIPKRNVCDIVLSLLFPGQPDDSVIDLCQRCVALYYENAMTSVPCETFIKAVWEKIPADVRANLERSVNLPWPRWWIKKFERMGMSVPRCCLPSVDVLFLLTSYRDVTC